MKSGIIHAVLICGSLVVAFMIGELIVSTWYPQSLTGVSTEQTNFGLHYSPSEGYAQQRLEGRVVDYQFAAPHVRAPLKPGRVRVLVLGDSFTFGELLDAEDTYVSLLQNRIDEEFGAGQFSLMNAAVRGWGTADYVGFVDHFGDDIDPDMVWVFLNMDDAGRILKRPFWTYSSSTGKLSRAPGRKSYMKDIVEAIPGYGFVASRSNLLMIIRIRVKALERKIIRALRSQSGTSGQTNRNADSEYTVAYATALFEHLANWCKQREIQLDVTTTGWHRPPYSRVSDDVTEAFMATADSLFGSLGVPFYDPSGALWQQIKHDPASYKIPNNEHPNKLGAALIAQYTYPFLQREILRYCDTQGVCALDLNSLQVAVDSGFSVQ